MTLAGTLLPGIAEMNIAIQTRNIANKLKEQLQRKREEVLEMEKLWIKANRVAREAEGGWIGTKPHDEEDY